MKKVTEIINVYSALLILVFLIFFQINIIKAQSFVEEFDNIPVIVPSGWDTINHSTNPSNTNWLIWSLGALSNYSGIACITLHHSAQDQAGGKVNAWLVSPLCSFRNGDIIMFYSASADSISPGASQPDRMQLRLSINGSSKNVGVSDTSVGDFTNLLLDINPTYSTLTYPIGYPGNWRLFSLTLSGLNGPVAGRFAFRYYIENAQGSGLSGPGFNGSAIGIDSVAYISIESSQTVNEVRSKNEIVVLPNPSAGKFNFKYSELNDPIEKIIIRNTLGEEIMSSSKDLVDLSLFPDGVYYYFLQTKTENIFNGKILKIE